MKPLAACTYAPWEEVLNHVKKAVVFLDNASAEILHWHGGLAQLLDVGAVNVKEFSSFEFAKEHEKKAVFVVTSLLEGVAGEIIHDIITASHFQYVIILCAVSPHVHYFSRHGTTDGGGYAIFEEFEDKVLQWMGNMNFTVEIFHVPIFAACLGSNLFLTPSCGRLFPLIDSDLKQIELQYRARTNTKMKHIDSLKDMDFTQLPKQLQVQFKMFVSSLNSLLEELGVQEDIYSLGHTSQLLAMELESLPPARNRRKSAQSRASLLLVDRTLDLAAVTSHNAETLLDRIVQVLPRLRGHQNDVTVDMSSLCAVNENESSSVIAPGCLASVSSRSQLHLQTLLTTKHKEAVMDVNRQLIEAASNASLPISLKGKPTRISPEQLLTTLTLFKEKYNLISSNLNSIQVAMATAQALSDPMSGHNDELLGIEKGLPQSLADEDHTSVLKQIQKMLKQEPTELDQRRYSLDDVLCLLVHVYSLGGAALLELDEEEEDLQDVLVKRILETKDELPPLTKSIVGEVSTETIVRDIIEDLWDKFAAVAKARNSLQQFGSVLDLGSAVSPASHKPLLKQLVDAIFDPTKPDLPDVECKSTGLKDMLKSGFGFFRSVTKPRPSDHPLLILFVVGGITSTEVKQIKDTLNLHKPNTQVIIGSTRLVKPSEVAHSVLCQDNVNLQDLT